MQVGLVKIGDFQQISGYIRVMYGAGTSAIVFIVCSVPQGSVLGPLLFVLYVPDLVNVVEKHGLRLYTFADDSPLR